MTDAVAEAPEEPAKSKKKPLMIGLVLAFVGAGGGYFSVSAGLLPIGNHANAEESAGAHGDSHAVAAKPEPMPDVAFVPLEPMVISLSHAGNLRHLRFGAQLEVESAHRSEVETLLPRVMDVMNNYLRALEARDFEDPVALTRLRAQMLRRINIVTGNGRVRDLLIMDFVLN